MNKRKGLDINRFADWDVGRNYECVKLLGQGSYGAVCSAIHKPTGKKVAIKKMMGVFEDEVDCKRILRELHLLRKLSHPFCVELFDIIKPRDLENFDTVYVVLGLSESDLKKVSKSAIFLETKHIATVVYNLLCGLKYLHSANIVHRDLKPGNILIMQQGEVLLTDFGIAKPLKSSKEDGTDLTRVDIMMGTAKYLSPEQVQGRDLDGRADMYSLGLVLYECLAGHAPFKEDNDQATAVARLQRDPTPLTGIRSDVPSNVIAVINKMLRRKPEHRYDDCNEVAQALESAITSNTKMIMVVNLLGNPNNFDAI